jgi:murein DD-endopeptidase MepM/ murein hydrolase activator NlpD
MITVLQRQQVSKRDASPVNLRTRAEGVRWAAGGDDGPFRVSPPRALLLYQPLRKLHPPKQRLAGVHSFLQHQLIPSRRHGPGRAAPERTPRLVLDQRKPGRFERRRERGRGVRAETARRTVRAGTVSGTLRAQTARNTVRALFAAAAGRRWLLILLALAAIAMVAAAVIGMTGLPFAMPAALPLPRQRPALPSPAEVDPTLYGLVLPEPVPAPEARVNPVLLSSLKVASYRTQAGDSVSRIAARFNLNIDTLLSWNAIRDARAIPVGTQLSIPNANGLKYTVRRGDTLEGIARSTGIDLNGILDWNRLSSSVISVGQELFLPGARMNPNTLNRILGSLFMYPVQGRISSFFGGRPDPFTGVQRFHNGVDIVNRPLTPVLSAMAGTVGDVGFSADYGYYVIMKHSGGYQTLYGHLTRYMVTRGQKVQQGQKIGALGSTGYSTGPHLHFSIFHNGEAVDPLRFIK